MLPWYAVQSHTAFESRVADWLTREGVEAYWPSQEVKLRKHVRKDQQTVRRALFPGYLFVHTDNRRVVLATPRVLRIVGFGDHAVPIPDSEIDSIRILETSPTVAPCDFYVTGQPVRVARGPLTGAEGVVVRMKGAMRVVVSVHLLARAISAEVDTDALDALTPAAPLPKAA